MRLFGKGYAIQHCVSLFRKEQEEKAYKIYVTECLKAMTENTAKGCDEGMYLKVHFKDIAYECEKAPAPKTGAVSQRIKKKLRS